MFVAERNRSQGLFDEQRVDPSIGETDEGRNTGDLGKEVCHLALVVSLARSRRLVAAAAVAVAAFALGGV